MTVKVNSWINNIQSLLCPPTCLLCGAGNIESDSDLCHGCMGAMPGTDTMQVCQRCAASIPPPVRHRVCGACQHQPPSYAACRAAALYQHPMDYMITQLKFRHRLPMARSLGLLLAHYIRHNADIHNEQFPQAILPVPLHHRRLRERGFNQALEIARPVARQLKLPLLVKQVQRVKDSAMQSSLPQKQRLKNIKGVFSVVKPLPVSRIAIIDDVMTTGSTVEELARTLCQAGAERIDVWVCARAELN